MTTIRITYVSDYICPWCYIGKLRLDKILEYLSSELKIELELRPFLLYPNIPKTGQPKKDFAKTTKPGMGRALRQEAILEGAELNYSLIEKIPNSLEAHRLTWLSRDNVSQHELSKLIYKSYFEKGVDISNQDKLVSIAKEALVDDQIIDIFSNSNSGHKEVLSFISDSKVSGISVVPSLIIEEQIVLPGIQSSEVWQNYLHRAMRLK